MTPTWIVARSPWCVSRCARHASRMHCSHYRYHAEDERGHYATSERCLRPVRRLPRRILRGLARQATWTGSIAAAFVVAWRIFLG